MQGISQKAQINPIGAKENGTISLVVEGDAVVEVEVDLGVEEGVLVKEDAVLVDLIP